MANPTCSSDCTQTLPAVSANICSAKLRSGQIQKLYIALANADPFADVSVAAAWNLRLSLTAAITGDEIRPLYVIGSQGEPTQNEIMLPINQKYYGLKTFSVAFRITDTSSTNYAFMRQLECGGTFKLWYATADSLYGGNDGILVSIKLNNSIPEDNKDITVLTGMLTWESKFHPEVIDLPTGLTY